MTVDDGDDKPNASSPTVDQIDIDRLYASLTHLKPNGNNGGYIPRCLENASTSIVMAPLSLSTPDTNSTSAASSIDDEDDRIMEIPIMDMISEHNTGSEASLGNETYFTTEVKIVRFGNVHVREYRVGLGDNPTCRYGPPISLSWKYRVLPEVHIDRYERSRRHNRRSIYEMHLNSANRERILRRAGCQRKQIEKAWREAARVQWQRNMTLRCMPVSRLREWAGSVAKRLQCSKEEEFDFTREPWNPNASR